MFVAPSNWPVLKLRVGYPPASLRMLVRTLVPNERQALTGHAVAPESLVEDRRRGLEARLVGGRPGHRSGLVEDERLDLLGAHHGADTAATHVASRAQLAVAGGDRCGGQHHLAGLADEHERDLVAIRRTELVDARVRAETLEAVVDLEGDPVLVDEDRPEVSARGLALDHDRRVAEPGDRLARLAAGVGFLDAARERALAADRDAPARGCRGPGEHARREDQLVGRVAGGRVGRPSALTTSDVIARPPNPA